MNFLLLSYEFPPWSGGIGTYAVELAQSLGRARHRVTVLAPDYLGSPGVTPGAEVEPSPYFELLTFRSGRGLGGGAGIYRSACRLDEVVAMRRPDWIVVLDLHGAVLVGAMQRCGLARGWNTAAILHGSELHHLAVGRWARSFALPFYERCVRLFANSEWTLGQIRKSVLRSASRRAVVAGIGVSRRFLESPPSSPAETQALRREWNVPGTLRVLLTVARLVPRKGIDLVLEALALRKAALSGKWVYVVVGKGPESSRLQARAEALGLSDHVRLVGALPGSRLIAAYDTASLYVQLSREVEGEVEGLGITFLEAAARGLPALACRHGGIPEAVVDGASGRLAPPDDVAASAALLEELLLDDAQRIRLAEGARVRVAESFDWDHVGERLVRELACARPWTAGVSDDPRPHILLVSALYPPMHTGAGQQAHLVARGLGDQFRVTVLTLGRDDLRAEEMIDGVRIERVGDRESAGAARAFALAMMQRLGRGHRPDLLWVLGVGPATYAALAWARFHGVPTVVKLTMEGQDDPQSLRDRRFGWARLRFLRYAAAVICPSRRLGALARAAGLEASRVHVIPNGVDLDQVAEVLRAADDRPSSALAFLGPVIERKGVHLALEAVDRLRAKWPDLHLHVIGSGNGAAYETRMRTRAASFAGHVTFHGQLGMPWSVLRRCRIFVLPSEAEGLPNALLEAMALGLVPIVSDLPALRELVTEEVGLRVLQPTPDAWSRAIETVLSWPEATWATRAENARRVVRDRYGLPVTRREHAELFGRLVQR